MREHFPLIRDVTTFLIIAAMAYPFAFMGPAGEVTLIGKFIYFAALVLVLLSFAVKRPPNP